MGEGTHVSVTIRKSGALILQNGGKFRVTTRLIDFPLVKKDRREWQVETSTFEIGPSSFWFVTGSFKLVGSSTFDTGVQVLPSIVKLVVQEQAGYILQSNLTVSGSLHTFDGALTVAGFSSLVMAGDTVNNGTFSTSEFSKIVASQGSSVWCISLLFFSSSTSKDADFDFLLGERWRWQFHNLGRVCYSDSERTD